MTLDEQFSSLTLAEHISNDNETMEDDENHFVSERMLAIAVSNDVSDVKAPSQNQPTINVKPKPNFAELAAKPNVRRKSSSPIAGHILAKFYTGNIDSDDDTIQISSTPHKDGRRRAYLRYKNYDKIKNFQYPLETSPTKKAPSKRARKKKSYFVKTSDDFDI